MNTHAILVVEDDEPTQRLLRALLERSGFEPTIVANGAAALEQLRTERFGVVILDLMMKEVDGYDVVEALARESDPPPVVICTAVGPKSLRPLDPRIVRAVIRKPFDIEQLLTTIRGLAGVTDEEQARVLIVDDDMRSRYVMRAFIQSAEAEEVESGEEALAVLQERRPDVVLLDLGLPGISGEEVLRRIEEDPRTRDTPVVVVTSRPLDEKDRQTLLGRAAGVIDKRDLSRATLNGIVAAVIAAAKRRNQ